MRNHTCPTCVVAMDANVIPRETKRKGARVNFVFVFLAILLLMFSMILVLPSAYPTGGNHVWAQFLGYIALFAFLWLVLAIIVKNYRD